MCRKELRDLERSYGILKRYEDYGYSGEQAIKDAKSIDNWFSQHTNSKTDWASFIRVHKSFMNSRDSRTSPLRYDEKFIEICKDIGFSPKYQYQLLQLILQVPEDIMEKAEEAGLSTAKKIMLTHSKLRPYPQLQKNLIEMMKGKNVDDNRARDMVHQAINDIEVGYLRSSETGKTFTYSGDPEKRDLIKGNKSEAKQPDDFYMSMNVDIKKLLYQLTGHQLSKGETKYTEEMVKHTHNHRLNIAKSLNSEYRALLGFYLWYLKPAKMASDDMVSILNEEMDSAEQKEGMMKE